MLSNNLGNNIIFNSLPWGLFPFCLKTSIKKLTKNITFNIFASKIKLLFNRQKHYIIGSKKINLIHVFFRHHGIMLF